MRISNKWTLLLLLFYTITTAQETLITENIVNTYNENEKIYMFSNNKILEYDVDINTIVKEKKIKNTNYDIQNFTIVRINKKFFFIQKTGGLVLKIINNSLIRIDNSFEHKMQFNSSIFTHNNEIYRYGGYGFFGARDFIVKYDFESNEWETVKINSNINPEGRFDNTHYIKNNNLYIIGGTTVDKLNREKRVSLNDIWKFSFEEYSWTKILESEEITKFDSSGFEFDENIFIREDNEIKILDIETNRIEVYKINSTFVKSFINFKPHFHKGKLYFFVNRNNGERVLISRSKKELLNKVIKTKTLKKEYINLNTIVTLISILVIFLAIYLYTKYLSIVSLSPQEIKYKRNYIFITKDEYLVLKEFVINHNILENNILQNIVNKEQYERSHNIRRKNNLINTLNNKLQYLFNNNYIYIEIQNSEYDKRYKRYLLNLYKLKIILK
jgi:hypothetical protein|tara:strand:- start:190 stop:1518 length:1329 start_codon:yes stop_codon:yes gene_type:complete